MPIRQALLDAYSAKPHGLNRHELHCILNSKNVYGPDFPGEPFLILKEEGIWGFIDCTHSFAYLTSWE